MSTRNVVISDAGAIDQTERDSLPDYNTAKGNSYTPSYRAKRAPWPWPVSLTLALGFLSIVAYVIVRFLAWFSRVSTETSALDVWLILFIKVAFFLAPVAAVAISLYWLISRVQVSRIVRLANNHPVYLSDIRDGWQRPIARDFGAWSLDRFYGVEGQWAANSMYRSLNTLDVSRTINPAKDGGAADMPMLPAPNALLSASTWLEALEQSPHLLIYGPSKAGKSTIAQAVVASFGQCEYVVIDPLPNKPGENKWGGIDFVTISEHGGETATIRAALDRIVGEDSRRRTNMRSEVPTPLVVIVDEVLGLVDMLGVVRDGAGRTETRMSRFIRTMGASARHRGIKIILIGQGKNLVDLGLSSGTARNNYALVRAERNPATDERGAYIVTPDGEQAIDVSSVPMLASRAAHSARVWFTQEDAERERGVVVPVPVPERNGDDIALLYGLLAVRNGTEQRDRIAIGLFRNRATVRGVGEVLRNRGYSISNDELCRLRDRALE